MILRLLALVGPKRTDLPTAIMSRKNVISWLSSCALLLSASMTNAAYLDDGAGGTGLLWLELTETAGESWNTVNARIGMGGDLHGWEFATGAEFDRMVTNFGTGGTPGPGSCSFTTQDYCGWSTDNNGLVTQILAEFGTLSSTDYSYGWLADSGTVGHWLALLVGGTATQDYIKTHSTDWADGNATGTVGAYLVRAVPIPAAGYFFITALAGFLGTKRLTLKKKVSLGVRKQTKA